MPIDAADLKFVFDRARGTMIGQYPGYEDCEDEIALDTYPGVKRMTALRRGPTGGAFLLVLYRKPVGDLGWTENSIAFVAQLPGNVELDEIEESLQAIGEHCDEQFAGRIQSL